MKQARQILIVVGIFYVIYILLFLAKFDFNPSATIELSKNNIGDLSHFFGFYVECLWD